MKIAPFFTAIIIVKQFRFHSDRIYWLLPLGYSVMIIELFWFKFKFCVYCRQCETDQVRYKDGDPYPYCVDGCRQTTKCGETNVPSEHLEVKPEKI